MISFDFYEYGLFGTFIISVFIFFIYESKTWKLVKFTCLN